jgi:hypothetical protein
MTVDNILNLFLIETQKIKFKSAINLIKIKFNYKLHLKILNLIFI